MSPGNPPTESALSVCDVHHSYGSHCALNGLDLEVRCGEIFAILGPNGSGKTTLFRLISTIAKVQKGQILVFGSSVSQNQTQVRSQMGIAFQSPSLDPKLTVQENIRCQGVLYGMTRRQIQNRAPEVLNQLGIESRAKDRVETLSGGLKRRVELAKVILHQPRLLLMDEPSTGLDPAARLDLWKSIEELRKQSQITVLLTTHLLEEAEKADRIAIMHRGQGVCVGSPSQLRGELGEQVLTVQSKDPEQCRKLLANIDCTIDIVGDQMRIEGDATRQAAAILAQELGDSVDSITLGRPSLEDAFVARTGHQFWDAENADD